MAFVLSLLPLERSSIAGVLPVAGPGLGEVVEVVNDANSLNKMFGVRPPTKKSPDILSVHPKDSLHLK